MLEQQVVRQQGGSGYGYLFDVPLTNPPLTAGQINQVLTGLDSGSVTSQVRSVLLAQSLVVRQDSPIDVLQPGQRWVLRDNQSAYLVEKRLNTLSVSRMQLTLDAAQEGLLVDGPVATEVADEFSAAG